MKLGYARVSTEDQHLDLQLEALRAAGCEKIFQEKVSGKDRNRPELARLLEHLREGDVIVIWKLDRLAKSTRDLLNLIDQIKTAGAGFTSLSEPWADTTSPAGKMILTVFAGIAEFERGLILERTSTGRKAAKDRGVKFGPPPKLTDEKWEMAEKLLKSGESARAVAKVMGVHFTTIYRKQGRDK
jgi:DNA invertase Pin-like site-specific DNA recombinase